MPFIKLYGTHNQTKRKQEWLDEFANVINTPINAIALIDQSNGHTDFVCNVEKVYIEISWLKCPEETRKAAADYLTQLFKNENNQIFIHFTDLNDDLYIDGSKWTQN